MAISAILVAAGLNLLNTVIRKIWIAEGTSNMESEDKHQLVKGFILAYMENHDIEVKNIDKFISDIVFLLNDHKIFIKGDK